MRLSTCFNFNKCKFVHYAKVCVCVCVCVCMCVVVCGTHPYFTFLIFSGVESGLQALNVKLS